MTTPAEPDEKMPWETPTFTVVAGTDDIRGGVIDLDEDFTGRPS